MCCYSSEANLPSQKMSERKLYNEPAANKTTSRRPLLSYSYEDTDSLKQKRELKPESTKPAAIQPTAVMKPKSKRPLISWS